MYVGQWRCYEGDKSNCVNLQFIQDARPKTARVFYVWTQAHNCKYNRTYSVSPFFNLKKKEGGKKLLSSGNFMQRKSFFFILHIRQLRRYTDVLTNRIFCATFHAQSCERRKKET